MLQAGSYTLRVTCLRQAYMRIDCIDLTFQLVPVQPATWGRIKTFYLP